MTCATLLDSADRKKHLKYLVSEVLVLWAALAVVLFLGTCFVILLILLQEFGNGAFRRFAGRLFSDLRKTANHFLTRSLYFVAKQGRH